MLVGVNHSVREDEKRTLEIFRLDPESERRQVERVQALRARRDASAVEKALDGIRDAARSGENLVPPCLAAVKALATHGEMCGALRDVFGEYHPDSLTQGV